MNTNWNDPTFQGFGGRQSPFGKRPPRPNKERKAIGTPLSRTLINLAVTLIFAAVYFYVVLPPINLQAEEFYLFMLLCCAVYCGCAVLTSGFQGSGAKGYFGFVKKQCRIPMIIAVALVAVAIVGGIVGWQVIRAGAYRDLLTVETGDFATEVEEISYDQIPMLDKDSAETKSTASGRKPPPLRRISRIIPLTPAALSLPRSSSTSFDALKPLLSPLKPPSP